VRRREALLTLLVVLCLPHQAAADPVKVARLKYGGGGDWYANPTSVPNLVEFIKQNTAIEMSPDVAVVEHGSDELFEYACVFVTGHGNIRLTEAERNNLRRYLLGGGFMHIDDNYGMDEHLRPELKRLFPDKQLIELPYDYPVYHCLYDFPDGLPKIHEHHGGPPHGYGIIHEGRVVLLYSYNTDINDGWEDPEVHNDPPEARQAALRIGANILTYALSH